MKLTILIKLRTSVPDKEKLLDLRAAYVEACNRISPYAQEHRLMKEENHKISKVVIEEAKDYGASCIILEDLTNIRERIRAKKRERTRLHRWSFYQLQQQIEYKAIREGIGILYVNPAYSSKLCLQCGSLGSRKKNRFTCTCGNRQHSDLYACEKLCRFAQSAG